MMRIRVELYGLLGKKIPEFASSEGVDIELPDEANVKDLLNYMKIPEDWGVTVAMDSRLLKQEDRIKDGCTIRILQAVHGG